MLFSLILTQLIATVSVAGGWGQMAGHSFVSSQYGLGVDQFLEFKVVTADGQLKVANNVSNPDLFWALRGGGGSTWGVVTEATVKAYPHVPIAAHVFSITSKTASLPGLLGLDSSSDGLFEAIAYMGSQLPTLMENGASGQFLPTTFGYLGASVMVNENATEAYAKSLWDPVLDKMSTYDGMDQWQAKTFEFNSFQDFYEAVWPMVGITTGGSGTGDGAGLWNLLIDVTNATTNDLGPVAALGGRATKLAERYGRSPNEHWAGPLPKRYTSDGDYDVPTPSGLFPMDGRLLARRHLESLPSQPMRVKRPYGSYMIIEAVAGNKVQRPDDDTAVLPAWRDAYVQVDTSYFPPIVTADVLREIAPEMGVYSNEVR